MPPRGPKGASAGTSTGPAHVAEATANIAMSVTAVTGNTREIPVQVMKEPEEKKSFTEPEAIASPSKLNTSIINPLKPIFVSKLEDFLADYPDATLVSQLCTNLRVGTRIGFEGQRTPRFSKKLPTALNQPSIVTSNLGHEVSLGRVAGPFETPPFPNFQVSPIGLVPKKNSKKFRTIFHLSFPKSGSTSINASISKDDFSLQHVTINTGIQGIKRFGHGCFLAKTDIESAFRLIPVHPDDYELLGMYWEGKYYYDKVLPFGLRSAPHLFNQLSDTIEWILLNKCMISFVCHILDDFLIMEPPSELPPNDSACQQSLTAMMLTFKNLNIPVASSKTQGPATVLESMGIILDSVRMEARLPAGKIERLRVAFASFKARKSCTLKELQSLIRTLNFACEVILPGHPYLQGMIDLTRNIKQHYIKLSAGFFKDIAMWKQFIVN